MGEPVRVETGDDGTVRVVLAGTVFLARHEEVVPQVERALKAENSTRVEIDLHEVTSLDSSGVALLILLRRLTVRSRADLRVRGARPEILQHLHMVGVSALLGLPPADGGDGTATTTPPGPGTAAVEVLHEPFDLQRIKDIRDRLAGYATSCGLSGFDQYKLLLAATEIMANVIVHGGGHGDIHVARYGDRLRIRVTDQGPGIPRRRVVRPRPRPGRIGSSGLWLARKVCERVDIETGPGGTTVLLTYALSPHDE